VNRPAAAILMILLALILAGYKPSKVIDAFWTGTEDHTLVLADTASDAFFNDDAVIGDVTVAYLPSTGKHKDRADWDSAMAACMKAGFSSSECLEAVADGEF
jgi:hypothetical protein